MQANAPVICFIDSSFQDSLDTSRSTGGYLIIVQGGVIDACSMMPSLIAHSTCEAEYCTSSLAAMATFFIRKIYNELHGLAQDHQLTIPIGIDSHSAMDTANSNRDTKGHDILQDASASYDSQSAHQRSPCSK
jgi:hypothetical protein